MLAASTSTALTEAAGTSETLVKLYQATQHYNTEDSRILNKN
jgi:hypothetical protein